jgi:hypothetical protein
MNNKLPIKQLRQQKINLLKRSIRRACGKYFQKCAKLHMDDCI